MHLRGQLASFETILLSAVVLATLFILFSAVREILEEFSHVYDHKMAEYYLKKIRETSLSICSLHSGSAIRISIGKGSINENLFVYGTASLELPKDIGCQILVERAGNNVTGEIWIVKRYDSIVLLV